MQPIGDAVGLTDRLLPMFVTALLSVYGATPPTHQRTHHLPIRYSSLDLNRELRKVGETCPQLSPTTLVSVLNTSWL